MKRVAWAVLMGIVLITGSAFAEDYAFDFGEEVKKGDQRPGFTNRVLVKTPAFTVGAIAVKDEIKAHRHGDGHHVIYIVSGRGTMMHGDKTLALKAGMIVHVPRGVAHRVKAEGGEMTLIDFAQPPFDPKKMDWIK